MKKIIDKRNYIILFIKEQTHNYYYFSEHIVVKIYDSKNNDKLFKKIDNIYKKYNDYYKKPNNRTDAKLVELLKYGQSLYKKSNGLIDITSGELLAHLDNDSTFNFKSTIDELDFDNKATLNNINIDMLIGSYATSQVLDLLKNKKYLINEDGNIITGQSYNDEKYKIGINDVFDNIIDIAYIENESMAVKGNTTTFKPYMVNPLTSQKMKDNKLVVVIAKDINDANFLANVLYLMDIKEGKNFIANYKAEALWYDGDKKEMTKGFNKYLA